MNSLKKKYVPYCLFLIIYIISCPGLFAQNASGLQGKWTLIPDESAPLSYYNTINLDIQQSNASLTIVQKWESKFPKIDSVQMSTNGEVNKIPINNRVWPYQVFMGVSMIPGSEKEVTAKWVAKDSILQVEESYPVLISQGKANIHGVRTYTLSNDGQKLTLNIFHNSDRSNLFTYVFRRGTVQKAYAMTLKNNWDVGGLLSDNAFLLSLQGIVNTKSPNLYFIYPDDYDYNFTNKISDFYKNHLGYSFTEIGSAADALKIFKDSVKGYIIWDRSVRSSLNVAFTLAGLEKAVVITPDMLAMVKKAGLREIADFRGKFKGKSDAQIYGWAFEHYWNRCNKKYIIWMGGVSGSQMKPGIADFGISKGSFFADLSTDPKDSIEYTLSEKIFSHMQPLSLVMGWHSYAKGLERNYVTLASHYALRVEGLNTFPNLSFTSRTPPSSDFKFRNHHNIVPHGIYTPKRKVYITCVQTDGLGLGAWMEPNRGSIPYAWEVTINWQWMAPVLLEYYYGTATNNDYFFGSLSGPGYMYPKAIPPKLLPSVIKTADTILHKLDLNVFETMDYSEGSTVVGNTDLPEYIVNDYYKYMPDVIGFLNGYAPSYTFSSKDGRPFISYDYYLDEKRPVEDAVSDLKELISLNSNRPYFLLLHVREFNSIDRVKNILGQLGSDIEVVPLDIFLKLAGSQPTFKTRFLKQK
ncbi:MAG: GxGYxYP domain-containing protein [Ginsengibacter sp.]